MSEYTNINKFGESVSISFFVENDKIMGIGSKMNEINEEAYMNGYNWAAFFETYLEKNYPNILDGLDNDSEAGMYCGYYKLSDENEKKAIEFEKIINFLVANEEVIYKFVEEFGEEINWD